MADGIHVEIAIRDTRTCQVSPHSEADDKTVTSVTKSSDPADDEQVIEEFTLTSEAGFVEPDGGQAVDTSTETLFQTGQKEVRRYRRQTPQNCVCERIEAHGCPVRSVEAVDGTLYTTFVAPDHDTLQSVLEELTDTYDEMSVCRLLQSESEGGTQQRRVLDVGALTDRQREVLSTAHEMGYFEHPREESASAVADELEIAAATFTEHLAAAQRNLLDELLEE